MIEAWITTEYDEIRLIFKKEEYDRIIYCKEKTNLHFKINTTDSEYCWVNEIEIPVAILAVTCLYTISIS